MRIFVMLLEAWRNRKRKKVDVTPKERPAQEVQIPEESKSKTGPVVSVPAPPVPTWRPGDEKDARVLDLLDEAGVPVETVVDHRTYLQAVCRFQLRRGLTVDSDPGEKTMAKLVGAGKKWPDDTYWDGNPGTYRSFGEGLPWCVREGVILTQENVSPTQADINMAKLFPINFAEVLKRVDPEWRHMFSAVLLTESSGRTYVEPRYEAHLEDYSFGPAQILYGTAKDLGYAGDPKGLNDPMTSSLWGYQLMRRNQIAKLACLVDPILEVAIYNAGGVYASGRTDWGIRHYGSHLSRFVKNWNAVTLSVREEA